jgi:hypothetical protein
MARGDYDDGCATNGGTEEGMDMFGGFLIWPVMRGARAGLSARYAEYCAGRRL